MWALPQGCLPQLLAEGVASPPCGPQGFRGPLSRGASSLRAGDPARGGAAVPLAARAHTPSPPPTLLVSGHKFSPRSRAGKWLPPFYGRTSKPAQAAALGDSGGAVATGVSGHLASGEQHSGPESGAGGLSQEASGRAGPQPCSVGVPGPQASTDCTPSWPRAERANPRLREATAHHGSYACSFSRVHSPLRFAKPSPEYG